MIVCDDAVKWAKEYGGEPFHALLCDPPYELGFMGKRWDSNGVAFQPETWAAFRDILHDGAFLMAFGGSRTYHRMACAIEDAGFVIHPAITWTFGNGFPKATRIDTQVDKAKGAEREVVSEWRNVSSFDKNGEGGGGYQRGTIRIERPATPLAATWAGHRYGLQAMKPAAEFICIAQKPYRGKPVKRITRTGAGALNVDGGRIPTGEDTGRHHSGRKGHGRIYNDGEPYDSVAHSNGRWASNFILCHHPDCARVGVKQVKTEIAHNENRQSPFAVSRVYQSRRKHSGLPEGYADPDGMETVESWRCAENCAVRLMDEQSGQRKAANYRQPPEQRQVCKGRNNARSYYLGDRVGMGYNDEGTASRFFFRADWTYEIEERIADAAPFFYCAKAGGVERDVGLENYQPQIRHKRHGEFAGTEEHATNGNGKQRNSHCCVKPIKLCQHLATLLLPPKEYAPRRLFAPFAGVASEMIAAYLAGWEEVVGVEMESEYCAIAEARLRWWTLRDVEVVRRELNDGEREERKREGQLSLF